MIRSKPASRLRLVATLIAALGAGGCSPPVHDPSKSDTPAIGLSAGRAADDASTASPSTTAIPTEPRRAEGAGDGEGQVEEEGDGHCKPMPKQGSPCPPGASYCVVDWGSPGGHSRALWCQDGTWHLIEEVNLP